ncbi:MAG: NUDIX domain-containing protein [Nanoarchaeota archaeon]|nr:NUDIX domain-containing protein [Nanoarchaeota archaeon]MBU1321633.1 NUDIX domain-containing protein [Nanoarchaeota archaeon]MBU1597417.1 NUDIX domain-containing protein [Nanoarchaeota archaeon]MBU2440920.1 NUDIX domain-containing protein [Nanoarchaeota archaeon]
MEKQETSIGAIVINSKNKILLILKRKSDYWEFPKGHMEGAEDELITMEREVKEETGINKFKLIEGFRHEENYSFEKDGEHSNKKVVFYLIKTDDKIHISLEHKDYMWVDYDEALKMVSYPEQKNTLNRLKAFLENFAK